MTTAVLVFFGIVILALLVAVTAQGRQIDFLKRALLTHAHSPHECGVEQELVRLVHNNIKGGNTRLRRVIQ